MKLPGRSPLRRPRRRAALLAFVLALACKRRDEPPPDAPTDDAAPAETEAIEALAPPWRPPERHSLAGGLLVHWLAEPASPAAHVRVLLPLPVEARADDARRAHAAAAVVAQALALELRRWLQRYAVEVELRERPGRLEVAVHGRDADLDAVLAGVARVVALDAPEALLERARGVVEAGLPPADPEHLALAALVAGLTGAPAPERLDAELLRSLPAAALARAWRDLLDPGRALLVVHAGRAADPAALDRLGVAWRRGPLAGLVGGGGEPTALLRLRPKDMSRGTDPPRRLGGPSSAPLRVLQVTGARPLGAVYLGRAIPLADDRDRALARLAQRVLQEDLDARLTIVGDRGLFVVRLPLQRGAGRALPDGDADAPAPAKGDPELTDPRARRLARDLAAALELIRARHSRQRLAQAAELWLGARMVQASLTGEDWTALWSDALDLAVRDGGVTGALARDARAMLGASPEDVQAWSRRWLDFERGEPGWAWVAVTGDADLAVALRPLTLTEPLAP